MKQRLTASMAVLLALFVSFVFQAQAALAAIDVNKSFSPATRYPGQISRLEIRLLNSALSPSTSVNFNDVFPDDVFVAGAPNVSNGCGGTATTTNTATRGEVTLAGGTIPAGDGTNPGVCVIGMDVYSARKGTYVNEIAVGAVTAITSGLPESNTQATQGTLTIILQDLTGSILVGLNSVVQGYETTSYTITLNNPNPVPLTGVGFAYDLWQSGYNIRAVAGTGATTCGAGTVAISPRPARTSAYGPTSRIDLAGGVIPANGSCTITFDAEPSADPQALYVNANLNHSIPINAISTNEGATNSVAITRTVSANTGIRVLKYFNGVTSPSASTVNLITQPTSQLRIDFINYNAQPVSSFNLTDVMPTSPAQMTVDSINSNSCGGTVTNNGTNIDIAGATVPGVTPQVNGAQTATCQILATVSYPSAGSYVNRIPEGTTSPGNIAGYLFAPTTATLTVSGRILEIAKSFSPSSIYQGDTTNLTFTLTNASPTVTVTNIDLTDDLNSMCSGVYCPTSGFRVGSAGVVANTCGGTPVVVADSTSFQLNDMSVPPASSCTVTVGLTTSANSYPLNTRTNTIPIGGITFDTPGNPGQIFPIIVSAPITMSAGVRMSKAFSPTIVGPLGISRLTMNFTRYSVNNKTSTSAITFTDNLPAGFEVAPNPNVSNGCGGTLSATPGSTSISLTGGSLPVFTGTTTTCSVLVNVRAAALTPPATTQVFTNTFPGGVPGTPNIPSARHDGQPSPYDPLELHIAASANLTVRATSVSLSKEFAPTAVNGGAPSRVTITLSNVEPTAVALSSVSLTDSFAGTDLRLYSNINPTFTNLAGVPNSGGCNGGVFTGTPGGNSISLSGASIAAGSICKFEFNVTAFKGGNHINTISAGDLVTAEGVTNPANVAATLTVGRQVNVGKGFSPNIIAIGEQSTLTIDFYNTNVAPNDETGASPALIDTLPAGLTIVGVPTTTCAGGTVSTGTSGASQFIRLDGGTFIAESVCKITAQVTATASGVYSNNIAVGDLVTLSGANNPDAANADLRVIAPPTITKSFLQPSIPIDGISRIRFTIANPNNATLAPTGLTGVSFSDTLANMSIAAPLYVGGTCSGLSHNAAIGGTNFTATNISIGPSASCYIDLDVTSSTVGLHDNQTTGVTTNQTVGPGSPSNVAQLRVLQPVTLSKAFSLANVAAGEPVRMTFVLTNPNPVAVAINNPGFTDTFPFAPGQMSVAPVPGLSTSCGIVVRNPTNSGAPAAGDTGIYVRSGSIPANGSCIIELNVVANAAGNYVNTTSTLSTLAGIAPAASASVTVDPRVVSIKTVKTATVTVANGVNTAVTDAGDVITYTITVRNTGNTRLTSVGIASDTLTRLGGGVRPLSSGPTFVSNSNGSPAGTLVPNETATFTATYTLVQADIDAGGMSNTATATGTPSSGPAVTDVSDDGIDTDGNTVDDPTETPIARTPSIETTKTATATVANGVSNTTTDAGDVITYTITIRNTGNVTLTSVGIASDTLTRIGGGALTLGSGPTFVSNSGSSPAGTLIPGETARFTASYTLVQADVDAGGVSNTATGRGTPPTGPVVTDVSDDGIDTDGNTVDDPTETLTPPTPALKTVKTATVTVANGANPTAADAGDVVTYTITLRNTGNTTLTSVGIASDTLTRIGGGALTLGSGPTFVSNSGSSPAGTLLPGETATFTASYTLVQADIDAGGVSNTATGRGTPPTGPAVTDVSDDGIDTDGNTVDDPTETLITRTPSIETTKTVTTTVANGLNSTIIDAGDVSTYTITIRNTGNVTLTSVGIASDNLTRLGGGALALTSGPTFVSNSGSSPAGTLVPGETATFTASYTLVQADINAGGVSNTATGIGTPPSGPAVIDVSDDGIDTDGNTTNDPTETLVTRYSDIKTVKTATVSVANGFNPAAVDAGDVITYTITLRNAGNTTLSSVAVLSDTLTRLGGVALTLGSGPTFVSSSNGSPVGTLIPGEVATYTASYTLVQADIDAGGVSNTATGRGISPEGFVLTDISDNGIDTDGNTVDDPTVTTITRTPSIETTKTAAVTVANGLSTTATDAGDVITYTITIRNTGNVTLTSVGVASDTLTRIGGGALMLGSGPTFVSNSGSSPAGTLIPGETATFTATYTLVQADIDAGGVSNTATGRGTPPAGPAVTDISDNGIDTDGNTTDDATVTTITRTPSIETTKTAAATVANGLSTTATDAGDVITYTITLRNTGNTTLTSVGIASDTLTRIGGGALTLGSGPTFVSNSGSSPAGTLIPGETATFTASYTLVQADVDAGGVSNTATGRGTPPTGPAVTDVSDDGIDTDGNTVDDPTETLITRTPSIETTKTATVTVANGINTTATDAGDVITYTITLRNTGNVTLTSVGIASDNLTRIGGGTLALGSGPTFVSNSSGSPAGTLAPNETATFTASYTLVQADIDAGGVSNTATGTGTPPTGPAVTDVSDDGIDTDGNTVDDPTETLITRTPSVETTKTATVTIANGVNNAITDAGDVITYTITVRNTGNTTLTSVGIASDTLTRIGGGALTLGSGPTFVSNSGSSPAGTLAPNETATFTASYTLVQADIDAGGVSNTATGRGTPPTGPAVTDVSDDGIDTDGNTVDDPTETLITRTPSIETTKFSSVTVANGLNTTATDAGDVITYTITLRNTGNTTLTSVGIASDTLTRIGGGALTLTSGPNFVSNSGASAPGTLIPGETAIFTASYTLVQADIDAGGVSNTATGRGAPPTGPAVTDVSDDGIDTDGNTVDDPTETLITRTPSIKTVKMATVSVANGSNSATVDAGDVVTYTITVRNTGNTTLTSVGIASDTLTRIGGTALSLGSGPTFVSNSGGSAPGTLIPGETATFTASYTLVQADIDAGGVSNTATGRGTPPTGPAITDISDNGIDTDGNTVDDPTVTLISPAPGIVTKKVATVTLAQGANPAIVDAGDAITYTITIRNTGNTTLTSVGIASDTLTRIGGGVLTLTSGPTFVSNSGASAPGTLLPGEVATFTASYTLVQADIDTGGVSNTATGRGTPPSGPALTDVSDDGIDTDGNTVDDPTETMITRTPSIETTKTAAVTVANGLSTTATDAGDVITYTITLRNTGNVTLTSVGVASDTLTRIGGGALTLGSGPTFVSNSGASAPGTLIPGETATFTASYTLVQADIDAGGVSNTATGRGTPPTGPAVTDVSDDGIDTDGNTTDDPTETLITRTPSIETTKTAAVTVANGLSTTATDAGDVITYTITIRNTGNVTLTSVGIASDTLTRIGGGALTLGSGPTFVSNSGASAPGTLIPGETATFTASYTLVQADVDAGGVSNTATGRGTPPTGPAVTDVSDDGIDTDGNTVDDPTETLITRTPSIKTTKFSSVTVANGLNTTATDAGDVITYTITIRNTGNTTLTAVGIASDNLTRIGGGALALGSGPTFVSNSGNSPAGTLVPGETATFTARYTLVQADVDAGGVSNTATGTGRPPTGPAVTDVSDDGIDTDGNTVDDPTETLVTTTPSIKTTKTATVTVANGLSTTATDAGDVITYTITIRNTGNTSLTSVGIASDTLTRVGGGPLTLTSGPTFVSNSGSSPAGTLIPGETATFTANYTLVQADVDAGGVSNTATGRGTPPTGPAVTDVSDDGIDTDGNTVDDPTETLVTPSPAIETTKTATVTVANGASSSATDAGDVITYTITVRNTGNVTLTSVGIASDTLTRLGGGALTLGSGPSFVSNSGSSPAGTLIPGETATFTASYTLVQADVDAGGVSNTATGRGTPPTGPAVTDVSDNGIDTDGNTTDDPTVTEIPRASSIKTVKTATVTTANGRDTNATDAGDVITYTITVRNTGNTTLTGVAIGSDTLTRIGGAPLSLTTGPRFVSNSGTSPRGTLTPGETATFTASYRLVQADIDAGGVSNTATGRARPPSGPIITDVSDDGIDTDGNTEDDPTETLITPVSSLKTTKTATVTVANGLNKSAADADDVITYTITIRNTGNTTLTSVGIASDNLTRLGGGALALTTGPTFVSNSGSSPQGTLVPNERATFTATYRLIQADVDAGGVSNTATGTGTPPSGPAVTDVSDDGIDTDGNTEDDPTETLINRTPSIETTKTATVTVANGLNPSASDAGDVITYTITVRNTGNTSLTSVGIASDTLTRIGGGRLALTSGPTFVSNSGSSPAGTLAPSETATFTASYTLVQADVNAGGVSNTATGTGTPPSGAPVTDVSDDGIDTDGNTVDDPTETLINRTPQIGIVKTASIAAFSNPPKVGDLITYTYVVTNTGNVTVYNVSVAESAATFTGTGRLPRPTYATGGADLDNGAGTPTDIAPSQTVTFTATYAITQADINTGVINNQATATGRVPGMGPVTDLSDESSPAAGNDDPTVVTIPRTPALKLEKTLERVKQVFPFVYEIVYRVRVINSGNMTLNQVMVRDDLGAALRPGQLVGRPTLTLRGFSGAPILNAGYDGVADTSLLAGTPTLRPGESGTIVITTRANFASGFPPKGQGNTAYGTATEIPNPVASDDPTVTPGNPDDTNPTPEPVDDADNDGAPDPNESDATDRDGDGIPDRVDYDPTGYFYCEETGQILSGGSISVTGPLGTQRGVGSSNNITIVRDGSGGSYQFHVQARGRYTLAYDLPPTGVASTSRFPGGRLDVTSLLPANPAVLGGSEIGSSGRLSDYSAAGNRFYRIFDIEDGDPTIFSNNIPLMYCGAPTVAATKQVVGQPVVLPNGATRITYRVGIRSTGSTVVKNVMLTDDLNAVFGAGRFTVSRIAMMTAPAGFAAGRNPSFNGGSNINLLTQGGSLLPGEAVEVEFAIDALVENTGSYTNTVYARGESPLDGRPVPPASAAAAIDVHAPNELEKLIVEKATRRTTARLGEVIPYTITVKNPEPRDRVGVDIVDYLPAGFTYRPGTARIDGVAVEPTQSGRRLVWTNRTVLANATVTVSFALGVGAAAAGTEFVNLAWVEDPLGGIRISNIGKAVVRREHEHVFDCGEIIGKVFDDKNRNGYQDDGEPGLPGVRVATATGRLITTDKLGRFSVPCAAIPDQKIGSNFIMKLDTRTLPTGYRLTTENPRVVRLTRGKLTRLNFGASISSVTRIELNAAAFVGSTDEPNPQLLRGIDGLVAKLQASPPSVVSLSYHGKQSQEQAQARLKSVSRLISERWQRAGGRYRLDIESRVVVDR